jgi:hypothetical protein
MPDIVPVRCARVTRLNAFAHAKRVRPAAAIVARVEECASAKGFAPQDQFATTTAAHFGHRSRRRAPNRSAVKLETC